VKLGHTNGIDEQGVEGDPIEAGICWGKVLSDIWGHWRLSMVTMEQRDQHTVYTTE
jgi:hypothetical protein